MEVLGDLLRWWQALSAHSRVAYATGSVIVAIALGAVTYQGYSGTTAPVPTDAADANRTPSPMQFRNPLSLPLPGTTRRRQAETAQLLESTLSGYDYIASVQASFAVGLSEAKTAQSSHLSLQLRFQPTATLPDNWLNNLVTFVLHTVSGLQPADLLITDSRGEVLYAKGQPTAAVAMMTSSCLLLVAQSTSPRLSSKSRCRSGGWQHC